MGNLWKITAKRANGKVLVGMSVEIAKNNTTGKPNAKDIAQAILTKYGIKADLDKCHESYYEIGKF